MKSRNVETILGKGCALCGCPYPGDHTAECPFRGMQGHPAEVQQSINEKIYESLDSIRNTMQHILDAVRGLKDICEHQQKEIDKLKQCTQPRIPK